MKSNLYCGKHTDMNIKYETSATTDETNLNKNISQNNLLLFLISSCLIAISLFPKVTVPVAAISPK